ncbi:HNH endonuclease [Dietzia cinnamea]|uniref:HNH endonuclease signature motif containing protein n=1 Tax=Dietzia cinnamea TaxID=321318 RepID=UPI0021A86118|nr:HNH endonuclease signature motif containing protein [Dietzia cinnamea]MCT1711581.1 HNH endonuclease [Dietzia cinnamea]
MVTTARVLFAVPDGLGALDMAAVSEAARAATLAQNRAGATRLEAAYVLVEQFTRAAQADGPGSDGDSGDSGGAGGGGGSRRPGYARLAPAARARDHLVAACQLTCWHAERLVTAGVQIHTRLSRLCSVVERGVIPEELAVDLACRLAGVPDAIVGDVEDEVLARFVEDLEGGDRPSRPAVNSAIDEAVERFDPAGAQEAAEAAAESREVRFRGARDGMATMWAKLTAADAELLRRRIETDAAAAAADGLDRPIDQLRADALAALAVYPPDAAAGDTTATATGTGTGTDAAASAAAECGIELGQVRAGADLPRPSLRNAARAGVPIRISVIASAVRGLPNRVEFVHGTYSSFEWLCTELLEGDEASVRFELIDPAPGVLDHPEHALRYLITPAMAERIRLPDGTCRHPGCSVPAKDCDVHVIAFNKGDPELGGPTLEWNLVCLCRKHHREKTFGTNTYRTGPLGELIICTDTGHEHRTRPRGPLARARDAIREREWAAFADRIIADDGTLINPPGHPRHGPHTRPA